MTDEKDKKVEDKKTEEKTADLKVEKKEKSVSDKVSVDKEEKIEVDISEIINSYIPLRIHPGVIYGRHACFHSGNGFLLFA